MKSLHYLSAMAVISIIMGLIYVSVQQAYRSNANDPQVQVAYDIRNRVERGGSTGRLLWDSIELENSLGLFAETFDANGRPIQSTGLLHGQYPQLPSGVLDFVRNRAEDRVTWQPEPAIRMAMVVIKANASPVAFIAVGRSLKETEVREAFLVRIVIICWVLCIAIILISWLIHYYIFRKQKTD
jgi:hypothetical protein